MKNDFSLGDGMIRYVFVGLAFCLVIGFQNCARTQEAGTSNNDILSNPSEKVDVSQTEIVEVPVEYYIEHLPQPITQAKVASLYHMEIDVKSGVIQVIDQNNQVNAGVQFCLSQQEADSLRAILNSAEVCDGSVAADPNAMCAQVYAFPYAKLHTPEAEISLGEASDTCHHGPDLCGDQKAMLQSFLANLQGSLLSKTCQ
jgi:hypothetical protein